MQSQIPQKHSNRKAFDYGCPWHTAPAPATKSSGSRSRSSYTIELVPDDKDLFKKELLAKKQAKRIVTYKDGSVKTEIWDAGSFAPSSDLSGNVSSQIWHRKDKDQIVKVVFEV